jgi:hypothetical protein
VSAAAELQEAQKQVVDGKLKPFKPVINQMVVSNSMLCKKVIMTVALLGNVLNQDQIIVKYAPGSNGGGLLLWIPCRQVTSNTSKPKVVLSKLGSKGVTEADAILFAQALGATLMEKCKNKYATIMDPFLIGLDQPCNINKQPNVMLFRTKEDLDNGCFICLDVPSVCDYLTNLRRTNRNHISFSLKFLTKSLMFGDFSIRRPMTLFAP